MAEFCFCVCVLLPFIQSFRERKVAKGRGGGVEETEDMHEMLIDVKYKSAMFLSGFLS